VPPFDDVRARQAVAMAVNRARLARLALGDAALPTCQALPSVVPGYEPYCPYGDARGAPDPAPNLAAARALVRQSRSDGAAVTVTAPADVPGQLRAARALAQTLRSIGWHARMRARTPMFGPDGPGAYGTQAARSDQPLIGWAGWFADLPAASKTLPPLASCDAAKSDTLHSGYNLSRWCDPALDRLMNTANALDATDPATAARLWARVDRAIVDSAAIVPIAGAQSHHVTSARIGNFQYHPALFMLVSQIWVQ